LLPLALAAAVGAGVAMAAAAATSSSGATVKAVQNAKFGTILVAANGKTLYRYTEDGKGVNRCSADKACAPYWPPLLVKPSVKPTVGGGASASLVGSIKAAHGMRQVTYAGWPLYYFAGDKGAGQVNGQAFENEWYVVDTKGAFVKHAINQNASAGASSSGGTTTTDAYNWG
jgi:predicted lipoprotein with Yx(FWY)xxD motif